MGWVNLRGLAYIRFILFGVLMTDDRDQLADQDDVKILRAIFRHNGAHNDGLGVELLSWLAERDQVRDAVIAEAALNQAADAAGTFGNELAHTNVASVKSWLRARAVAVRGHQEDD